MASEPADALRLSLWAKGGIPVIGSSFVLRVLIDQDGVMRRSDAEFSEITCRGTSAVAMFAETRWGWRAGFAL